MERHLTGAGESITSNWTQIRCPKCADHMWHTILNEDGDEAVLDCEKCGFVVRGPRGVLAHHRKGERFARQVFNTERNKLRAKHVVQGLARG